MQQDSPWLAREFSQPGSRRGDHRSAFQRDKARILHSAAFRRLQAKTQVLGIGLNDFYRTRLTHSLEASQIGQGIAAQLWRKYPQQSQAVELDTTLIEALCLAHDIGHPPFGHGGEVALHYMMRQHGGFEGNAQTFRILTRLEPYTQSHGMNLSRRTLLGLIKYPGLLCELNNTTGKAAASFREVKASQWHPPKGLYSLDKPALEWVLSPLSEKDRRNFTAIRPGAATKHHRTVAKSFDCSVMELADDIAYSIHDLEDAIVTGLVNQDSLNAALVEPIQALQLEWLSEHIGTLKTQLFSPHHYERKDAIGALVNYFITHITVVEKPFDSPLLGLNAAFEPEVEAALTTFKRYVYNHVIRHPEIQIHEYKGQQLVMALFSTFASDPMRLLPRPYQVQFQACDGDANKEMRVIADYISAMTDEHTSRLYGKLFMPRGALDSDLR